MYVVIAIEPYRSVQNISLSFSLIKSFSAHINGKKETARRRNGYTGI